MKELIEYIARSLADSPENVVVTEVNGDQGEVLELKVEKSDLGKIIGRQGRTAKALRTLVGAAAIRANRKVTLEILE